MQVTLDDHSAEAIEAKNKAVEAALTAIGLFLEGEAKLQLENDPRRVDTGRLRNSIANAVRADEGAVYIGTNVEYAPYVHEGTVKMAANRFLRNAIEKNEAQCRAYLIDALTS